MGKFIISIIVSAMLIGCAGPMVKVMRYSGDDYSPTTEVQIFRTAPVDRKYIEIAELSLRVKKSNQETAVFQLREKAKSIGADALILMGERSAGAIAMPMGQGAVAVPLREIYAIAIKYME